MEPIVIACAITGSVPRKKDNPAVPTMPAEQIESTHAAFEAGAFAGAYPCARRPGEFRRVIRRGLPKCRWVSASIARA